MEGLGVCPSRLVKGQKEPDIDCHIDSKDDTGKDELYFSRETGRIDDGKKIVLNEALRVARLASPDTKEVLGIRERANTASELNEEAPHRSWKMDGDNPAPARDECGTQENEGDKGEVKQ
jgi:hypothetical protein